MLKRIVRRRVNGKPPGERRQAEEDALRGGLFLGGCIWLGFC